MSDNVKRDNRRALPKYLLTILLFGLLGGVLGFFTGVAGAAGVAETVRQALDRALEAATPWGIVISAVILLGTGWYLYAAAKRRCDAWDGEDEDTMDAVEQQLGWALLLTGLMIVLDFFFFAASIVYGRFLPDLGKKHYGLIARELHTTLEEVRAAEKRISALDPYPGRSFQPAEPTLEDAYLYLISGEGEA